MSGYWVVRTKGTLPQVPVSHAWRGQTEDTPVQNRASHAKSVEHSQSAPSVHPGQGLEHTNLENCPKSSTPAVSLMPAGHTSRGHPSKHAYKRGYSVKLRSWPQ